jgi:succinate dehydrogenase / fumarate reductase cytochrome b subunit
MKNDNTINSNYSIVGKKILLGFSGLILLGFIVGHLIGNLSILVGPEAINSYAYFLHDNKMLLYSARGFLLINLFIHLYISISLTLSNSAAKQVDYTYKANIRTTFASKTMIFSGLIVLAFLIYHLLHFTFGVINPDSYGLVDHKKRFDVYTMVISAFSNVYISLIYIAALISLGFHLSHAFFSVCQTFSITNTGKAIYKIRNASKIISAIIIFGYLLIPTTILFEIVS